MILNPTITNNNCEIDVSLKNLISMVNFGKQIINMGT